MYVTGKPEDMYQEPVFGGYGAGPVAAAAGFGRVRGYRTVNRAIRRLRPGMVW